MPRPTKWRRVAYVPEVTYFKPTGIPLRALEEVCLCVEEAEALRLKDIEGLEQGECAAMMDISRPTFHRVLAAARQKVSDALLNGKAIRIEGGNFHMDRYRWECLQGHEWEVPFEAMEAGPPPACPSCHSVEIRPIQPLAAGVVGGGRRGRRGAGWQGGRP